MVYMKEILEIVQGLPTERTELQYKLHDCTMERKRRKQKSGVSLKKKQEKSLGKEFRRTLVRRGTQREVPETFHRAKCPRSTALKSKGASDAVTEKNGKI